MKIKDFLKPTKSKIIITLVLIIVFVPFLRIDNGIRCIQVPCPSSTPASLVIYLLGLISSGTFINGASYTIIIIGVIASYIVSGLVIIINDKIRKFIK